MFSFFRRRRFFSRSEENQIKKAIRQAESASSGEIRVFVESFCDGKIEDRTIALFKHLKMHRTRERNGVLIYIAMDEHRFSIFGDEGIHQKLGFDYWLTEVARMKMFLKDGNMVDGLCTIIIEIGEVLKQHFPHQSDDKDELSNKPVYGR